MHICKFVTRSIFQPSFSKTIKVKNHFTKAVKLRRDPISVCVTGIQIRLIFFNWLVILVLISSPEYFFCNSNLLQFNFYMSPCKNKFWLFLITRGCLLEIEFHYFTTDVCAVGQIGREEGKKLQLFSRLGWRRGGYDLIRGRKL